MVPQRLFVHRSIAAGFTARFTDLTATPFDRDEEVVRAVNNHEFGLGAAIFSRDESTARQLAGKLHVGLVTINDLIVSSADARLPFGGRRGSGHGATRGAEGLLELTAPKAITCSRSKFRPAYQPLAPRDLKFLLHYARFTHGRGLRQRFASLFSNSHSP
jgi:acyl-CoA reductase-like NAD-dependent aldehyde dehydrogenase